MNEILTVISRHDKLFNETKYIKIKHSSQEIWFFKVGQSQSYELDQNASI